MIVVIKIACTCVLLLAKTYLRMRCGGTRVYFVSLDIKICVIVPSDSMARLSLSLLSNIQFSLWTHAIRFALMMVETNVVPRNGLSRDSFSKGQNPNVKFQDHQIWKGHLQTATEIRKDGRRLKK